MGRERHARDCRTAYWLLGAMEKNMNETNLTRRSFVGAAAAAAAAVATATATPAFADEPQAQTSAADILNNPTDGNMFADPIVTEAQERLDGAKRVLVVVDYQIDFVSGGVFGEIEPAKAIEDALYDSIKSYQDAGDIVIYTMDTHPADGYDQTREGQYNPLHCVPGTPGWGIYGKVAELLTPEKATRVLKGTYGAKNLPAVIQLIKDQGTAIESIEIAGVSTTCRVLHNAILLYTFFPETLLIMDKNTTASYTDERTQEQLEELEGWGFCIRW